MWLVVFRCRVPLTYLSILSQNRSDMARLMAGFLVGLFLSTKRVVILVVCGDCACMYSHTKMAVTKLEKMTTALRRCWGTTSSGFLARWGACALRRGFERTRPQRLRQGHSKTLHIKYTLFTRRKTLTTGTPLWYALIATKNN